MAVGVVIGGGSEVDGNDVSLVDGDWTAEEKEDGASPLGGAGVVKTVFVKDEDEFGSGIDDDDDDEGSPVLIGSL